MSDGKKVSRPTFGKKPQPVAATKLLRPTFDSKAARLPNAVFADGSQAIIDAHLKAIMGELEAVGVKPVGVVAGVLHDGETSVNWCVSDDVHDDAGRLMTSDEVASEIASDIERSTAGE